MTMLDWLWYRMRSTGRKGRVEDGEYLKASRVEARTSG